jgi:aminopeptidase N
MRLLPLLFLACWHLQAQPQNPIYCSHANHQHTRNLVVPNTTAPGYDVTFYFLDLQADNLSTTLSGSVSITAQVTSNALQEVVFELSDLLLVDSVWVDNARTTFTHTQNVLTIALPAPVAAFTAFTARIFYRGTPQSDGFFSGISNGFSNQWGTQVTWTLSEPLNARDWFPCKQVLSDKADSAYIFITVPDHLMAGSNGLLTAVVPLPDNKKRFEWKTHYPIAYYLLSMTIAPFTDYSYKAKPEGMDSILIQNFVYDNPAALSFFKTDIDEVGEQLILFSKLFGAYPFANEKYGHCMAPFGGGMEHQTMTSLGFFEFSLDAHELGHQWFGDHVTCATWQDIWVNEGFARYSEYLAWENLRSKAAADAWMQNNYANVLSQPFGSVYVPAAERESESRIFNGRLTYNKGGALIHMLRNMVKNDDVFFATLKNYQQKFSNSVATGDDFREVLEQQSGMDFTTFFDDWYYGEGYPLYSIEWNQWKDSVFVDVSQTTSHPSVSLFEMPLDIQLLFTNGDTLIRCYQNANQQRFRFYVQKSIQSITVDPAGWLLKKINRVARNTALTGADVVTENPISLKQQLSLYPNPAREQVTLSVPGKHYYFNILDSKARVVASGNGNGLSEIDVRELSRGVYLLMVVAGQERSVKKMIIE